MDALAAAFVAAEETDDSVSDEYVLLVARLWCGVVATLDDHSVAAGLTPMLRSLVVRSPVLVRLCVESLCFSVEPPELSWLLGHLSTHVASQCVSHEFNAPRPPLETLTAMLEISPTLQAVFLDFPHAEQLWEELLSTKALSDDDMAMLWPTAAPYWLPASPLLRGNVAEVAIADAEAAHQSLRTHEARLHRFAAIWWSRDRFVDWICRFAKRAHAESRAPSTVVNVFVLLLHYLSQQLATASPLDAHWLASLPAEGSDMPRLGGLLSHLRKECPLGDAGPRALMADVVRLHRLTDAALVLFHRALNQRHRATFLALQKVATLNGGASGTEDAHAALRTQCRGVLWSSMLLSSPAKQRGLADLLAYVCLSLTRLSADVPLALGYVPQYYLDFTLDAFRCLAHVTLPRFSFASPSAQRSLHAWLAFVVGHVHDGRIANPEVRDKLLQCVCQELEVRRVACAMEHNPTTLERFLPTLLMDSNRNWVAVCNVLMRMWHGVGYGSSAAEPARMLAPTPFVPADAGAPRADDGRFYARWDSETIDCTLPKSSGSRFFSFWSEGV